MHYTLRIAPNMIIALADLSSLSGKRAELSAPLVYYSELAEQWLLLPRPGVPLARKQWERAEYNLENGIILVLYVILIDDEFLNVRARGGQREDEAREGKHEPFVG